MARSLTLPILIAGLVLGAASPFAWARIAAAGVISEENAKPGYSGSFVVQRNGTAAGSGVVDVYPARWSVARGEDVLLKVRATDDYDVRIFRLGWYGGRGATQVQLISGLPADPQPYPDVDTTYGLAEARWSDSVRVIIDSTWTPGLYAARIELPGGDQAETLFVVRDDAAKVRAPILIVVPTATHAAYNPWPGKDLEGKSLYGFNSSAFIPSESKTLNQAVKVSFDRPFFDGGGTGDVLTWEYSFIRWVERNDWEVAYCTDQDVHTTPSILRDRKAVIFPGHSEYWSRAMYDNALAARDAGVNMMFVSGDTVSWQIRFESGPGGATSTVVGYKESYPNDPEEKAARAAKADGNLDVAVDHWKLVTRGWRKIEQDAKLGIDLRRPGMVLTGLQSSGQIKHDYPWADLVVNDASSWIFDGTGMKNGDRIVGVMGYEVDGTKARFPEFDPFRKPGQVKFGILRDPSEADKEKGASAYYTAPSGAEVVAFGAMGFSWALDGYSAPASDSEDARAGTMVNNVLRRWVDGSGEMRAASAATNVNGGPRRGEARTDELAKRLVQERGTAASGCDLGRTGEGSSAYVALGAIGGVAALCKRRRRRPR